MKIEGASWVITMDERRRVLRNASIIIEDGTIAAIDKADKLKSENTDRVLDGKDKVVTPGFVNCHVHISYAHAVRGIFPDNLPQQEYLSYVFKLQRAMKPEEEYYTSLLAIAELLKNGCTCILDPGTITSLDQGLKAIEQSGIRAVVGRFVVDLPNSIGLSVRSTEEAIEITEQTIRKYDKRLDGRVRAWAIPHAPEYCTDELLLATKSIADRYGVGLTLHTSSSEEAATKFQKERGKRPIAYMAEKGILDKNVLLAHVISADNEEIELLRTRHANVVHCPSVAIRGSGVAKVGRFPEMLRKGVCVSLGNDAANSSYHLDMIRAMYLAAVLYKDARQDGSVMPPETMLEMGTVNGAKSIGLDDEIGSIEVGKSADLVIFNSRRPEWRTLFNPVNNLVFSADGRSVETVLVDGRVVVEGGKLLGVDEESLYDRLQTMGENLMQRVGISFRYRWSYE
jgi:cytosine/adenosine deaminase-related metal-dependent hydrolase